MTDSPLLARIGDYSEEVLKKYHFIFNTNIQVAYRKNTDRRSISSKGTLEETEDKKGKQDGFDLKIQLGRVLDG